jgi:signal transduction histidine kinase
MTEIEHKEKFFLLIVEDDDSLRELIVSTITKLGWSTQGVANGVSAVAAVTELKPDALLVDQNLPDMNGREIIRTLAGNGITIPFIIMTGQGDERLAVEMMKLGATDYLVKDMDFLDMLPVATERMFKSIATERALRESDADRERLREQLYQTRKMEAIGQLAGGIAHDFNNLLGGIIGGAELLNLEPLSDNGRQMLELILKAAERAADLTDKLLTFSRKRVHSSVSVDCFAIVNETVELLKHTIDRNINIVVESRSDVTIITGDASQLQNSLMNVSINAAHAMPNGGVLKFTLDTINLDNAYCSASPFTISPGLFVDIAISDTGCGMPPEVLSRIFEPFFTTKEQGKGTGLGLSAVYGTVQDHGGAITVYSEEGKGSVFHLYLPTSSELVPMETTQKPYPTGTGTILVIDDEELIRCTASALLQSLGYTVILAENGLDGVKKFKAMQSSIKLVILDMIMPEMGGAQAFGLLREINPDIPVVIASGFSKLEEIKSLKKQGVFTFMPKPFKKMELAEIVYDVLFGKGNPRGGEL